MRKRVIFLVSGILMAFSNYLASGQEIIDPEINPLNARFDNFQIDIGSSGSSTTCIYQDSKGFIWCGTEIGLSRFDGTKYLLYKFGRNDSAIWGYNVLSIFEDSGGDIWTGTYGALNRIDLRNDNVSHFLPDSTDFASDGNTIRYINEDRKGFLWLITNRNIYRFNRNTKHFDTFLVDTLAWHSEIQPVVFETERYLEDKDGNIWIATDNGLYLYRYDNQSWKRFYPANRDPGGIERSQINCIETDPAGNIWFGTQNEGLMKVLDMQTGRVEKIILPDKGNRPGTRTITAVYPDSANCLWAFGNRCLYHVKHGSGEIRCFVFHTDQYSVNTWNNNPCIDKIFPAKNNNLLLVSLYSGIVFQFDRKTEKLSLYYVPNYIVQSAIQDNTGNLWFGCVENNMFRMVIDSLPIMSVKIHSNWYAEAIHKVTMASDDENGVVIRLTDGFYRIRNFDITNALRPEKIAIPVNDCQAISLLKDSQNNLWFSFSKGVIVKYNPLKKDFMRYQLPVDTLMENYGKTVVIFEDRTGNIWFATLNEGVFLLKPGAKTIHQHLTYSELSDNESHPFLFDFLADRNNNLWIATSGGLYRQNKGTKKIKDYTGFDNTGRTYGSWYVRIIEDNDDIWILNFMNGPYRFNRQTETFSQPFNVRLSPALGFADMLIDHFGKIWTQRFDRITVIDPGKNTSKDFPLSVKGWDTQSLLLPSGMIFYIVYDRLFILNERIPLNKTIPPVYITGFYINDASAYSLLPVFSSGTDLNTIDLKHDQNSLRFEYAALNYDHPELNRYRHFMTGIDKDTVETRPGQAAEYRNVPPGRYRFWVTGSNNDEVWNPEGVRLDIRIHPPWYRSVISCFFYFFASLSLILLYTKQRISHLGKEKIRLESEIKKHTAELETKNERLAEADRVKTLFFTEISHEIRTPLSLITGPLDAILNDEVPAGKQWEMLEMMKRNAQRLMCLVDQLLDFSRIDSRKMKIILIKDDLIKCMRILAYEFLSLAETKHIKYLVEIPDKSLITWFDRDKIVKIVSNLLSNAFRYTPTGGMINCIIEIKPDSNNAGEKMLHVKVIDTGPGIPKEHHNRIFERFYRIEGLSGNDNHGTGIGLSLVQELTTLLHGEIKLFSTPGKGSEFIVTIPVGKDHLMPDEYTIGQAAPIETKRLYTVPAMEKLIPETINRSGNNKLKILLIEDNADLRTYIKDSLSDDYALMEAENGRTGLNAALTTMPDLIVTDIMMPDLDGMTLCSKLKNDYYTSHIPIIMLTAMTTSNDRLEGLRSGANDYITKPFDMAELKLKIANLLVMREKIRLKYSRLLMKEPSNEKVDSVDDKFMLRIMKIIHDNLKNFDFDAGSLQEIIGMSRVHLFRKLKILTGLSPATLIRNMRLEKAAELLSIRAGNITEIANSVGISNPSGFTKSFRKYFGVSPRNYLKK